MHADSAVRHTEMFAGRRLPGAVTDQAINPEVERCVAKRASATIVEIEGASHAVTVSQPKEVADLIRDAVRATS